MMIHLRLAIVLFALLPALAGCAGPRGALGAFVFPQVQAGGKFETVLVATSREKADDESEFFSRERARRLNFAEVRVSIPPVHQPGHIEKASDNHDPRRHFTTAGRRYIAGRSRFLARFNQMLIQNSRHGREVFVYVHGYNNTFAEGLFRAAQIRHDFDLPTAVTVHYSWPSAGEARLYAYDRDSASFARDGLVDLLEVLARSRARRIFLIGHSMGGLVTMEAMRQAALTGKRRLLSKLSMVVLASPDIDSDVFRLQMDALAYDRPKMVVLVSKDDWALRLSGRLRGGHARIGQGKHVEELTRMGIVVLDLTALGDGDPYSHSKFSSSPALIRMIRNKQITEATVRSANNAVGRAVRAGGRAIGDVILYAPRAIAGER